MAFSRLMRSTLGVHTPVILCVDDDRALLKLSKTVLESEGYAVITAETGSAALAQFVSQNVDAVVLDYEMPGMNGAEIALAMARLNPHVPKLLFSAHPAVPSLAVQSVEAFCPKTDGHAALVSRLRRLLDAFEPTRSKSSGLHMHAAIARLKPEWEN